MSKGKEEIMDWLYQFVKSFEEHGIAIQDLSEKFDENLGEEIAVNEQIKDEVWQAFMRRDDVRIEGSEEEVGVMKNLELSDTIALGYGIRKVVVQAKSVDVEMTEAPMVGLPVERPSENESGKGQIDGNDKSVSPVIAPRETLVDSTRPVISDVTTSIQRPAELKEQFIPVEIGSFTQIATTEPKEQYIPVENGSFTKAAPSPPPKFGNKKSYKIADDPRGTQGSQRRLQNLLAAARAEADGFHTPNLNLPQQRNDEANDIENNRQSPDENALTPEIDPLLHAQTSTAMMKSQVSHTDSSNKTTDIIATTNDQRKGMDIETPKHPAKSQPPTIAPTTPTVGYQYQSAPSKTTPSKQAQLITSAENDTYSIDYFAPNIARRGPVPGQLRRGRPKGTGHQVTPSSPAVEPSSPKDPSSMSFSSLAELEQFQTPKPVQKKRGRPKGPTIKHKPPVNDPRPETNSEDTADTGLHITESGLRSSRRQPKPRQFYTPTQARSPEPEPESETTTAEPGKSAASTTPSNSNPPRKHREPIYTSYEDLMREEDDKKRKAGIDGVYINPLDAKEGRSLARKKTLVVLIKSGKLRDPDLLESRKGTWIEVLTERRKALQVIVEAEAAKIAAATAEEEKSKKRKRDVESQAEHSKRSKPLDAELETLLQVPNVDTAPPLEAPSTELAKPREISGLEPVQPPEILGAKPAMLPEASSTEVKKLLEVPSVETTKPSEIPGPRNNSFPSNEELALEFEKFQASSAAKSSAVSSTNPDSFPSNEELALQFEQFRSGFTQQSSQDILSQSTKSSSSTNDPFVANSMQYGQQSGAWTYPRAPESILSRESAGPRSQAQFSHPISQYESPSHLRHQANSFRNEYRSPAVQQPQSPRWTGPLESHQTSATVRNFLPPVSNIDSYSSPYRANSEHHQIAGRHYQQQYYGNASAIFTPPPADRYRSPYEVEQQATPSFSSPNPWLGRNHIHQSPVPQSPVQQSQLQNSWPAGFLPPEPPKPPQTRLKTEWPSGFLPPVPSEVAPSSPMSIDSIQHSSPAASTSHTSDASMITHSQKENAYSRPNSSRSTTHPVPALSSVPYTSSPYSKPAVSTMDQQPQGLVGKQNGLGQVQISSPLSQHFNLTDSALPAPQETNSDSHVHPSRPENERQAQAPSETLVQVSQSLAQGPISIESAKGSQYHISHQTHPPETTQSQSPPGASIPTQIRGSPSVQPAAEPIPLSNKRKRSITNTEEIPTPQSSMASSSKLPESSTAITESAERAPPVATPDDVEGLKKAEAISFESFFARMTSVYNSVMGNLILSSDKTTLKFWSMAEGQAEPIWTMQVWKIAENPIVSMPGSNPMELRLKEKKDDESIVVHRFLIARTKEASKSANEMRANLVTARIFVQMANPQIVQAEDPEMIAMKPWKCEKCGSRFKNKEGIKYHLSKSQTSCNPSFNIKTAKPRPKKETPKKGKATKTQIKPVTSPNKTAQPEPIDEPESEPESESGGGDSDDSVFEWAAKVAGMKKSPTKTRGDRADRGDPVIGRSGKVYKSLGGERPALLEIADIVKKTPSLTEELAKIPSLPQTPNQSLPETLLPMSKEKVIKDIIFCLLRANNNALPGERGLWFAFVACWLKYYPTSKVLPEHKLFARALDELLEDGILTKITFDFAGARSRTITRSILSDSKEIAPSLTDIAKLKDDTKAKHPDFYIPPGFSPPSVILDILNGIGKLPPMAPEMSATQLNEILGSDEEAGKDDSSDDEFKPEVHALDAEDDLEDDPEDDPMDVDLESDGYGNEFSHFPSHTPPQDLQFYPLNQQAPSKINGSQMMKPGMRRAGHPLTLEERETRKRITVRQEQTWTPQPMVLQNSANGAWDVSSKPKRAYKLRERLPEPTTYMQDISGSWSVRPFGHGVNPIFARPNKIAVGNPQGEHYLQQREDSHRPVIHPNKPVMRPSVPSKFFLNKNLQGDLVARADGQIEMSKTTGLPKRHYTYRTRSQKDPEISRYTGLAKRGYRSLTPDPMDLMEASISGLTELDILNHYEAKPLEAEIGRQNNPGLDTIPSTPATPGFSHLFFNESAGLWNLAHPFVACTNVEKLKMQWLDRTAFTLETLPYSALEDNDELPPEQQTIAGTKRKRQQVKQPHIGVRKGLKNKWVMPRRLTSTPDDLLGVHRDVRYAADLLGTQMVNYDSNIRRKRQRFKEQGLAIDEEERLTMGIVVIRTMLGGLEMNIDWVILGSVFKDYSLNFLRKWWLVVWAKKKPMIDKLTKDFQEVFIVGYKKGQVPSIDYDHVIDYDFNTLIDWAMSKIKAPTPEKKVFDLPNSFSELKKKYALVPEARSNAWSDQYYYPLAAVYQRMNLVNSVAFSNPLQQETPSYEISDYALAKSWCRAAAVTPDHLWDSKAANKLLNRLPSAIIIQAREDLLKNKIITKNKRLRTNGRVYNLPDAFNAVFVRTGKIIYEKQYREAFAFKCELDQKFRNGETIVNIPWSVNEGAVLAITNLQAYGQIYVRKSNIRANKFGLTEGGYETRLIDKAKYRFQMDISPTPSYVYNEAIPNLEALISEPPSVGSRNALPVWRSITGEVIEGMWRKVLLGVTGAFVLRSCIDVEGLEKVFSPSLDQWEIKMLIDWGVERGVWRNCDYEGFGATSTEAKELQGWEVGDWWWMIVGRLLAEDDL